MKARPYTLLLHPAFLICLAILLLNDFVLKYEWSNWLTGKLSDFTGLFVFTIFLFVIFPKHRKAVVIFSALFFTWWKSPLSGPFIHFIHEKLSLPVHRVIDYTDLLALLVLPLAYTVQAPQYTRRPVITSVATWLIGIVSFFSFCATSMVPRHLLYAPYRQNEIYFAETFDSRLSKEEVWQRLNPQHLSFTQDSARYYKITEDGNFYQRIKNQQDSSIYWVPVTHTTDTTLYVRKPIMPIFILPYYVLDGDTLHNLEFRFYDTGKKAKPTGIRVEGFQLNDSSAYRNFYWGEELVKKYRKHFKRLFRDK